MKPEDDPGGHSAPSVVPRILLLTAGISLITLGSLADLFWAGTPGFGASQAVLCATGVLMIALGSRRIRLSGKEQCFVLVIIFAAYALLEVAATSLYWVGILDPAPTLWAYEESGETIHFDPLRGYRLTQVPCRRVRITHGEVEYLTTIKGNNEGFPDRDDFGPKRTRPQVKRVAVFGDSFTAAQYIEKNWPDYVEDLAAEHGNDWQLLNFSIDGGGVANWWATLTKLIKPQDYELDAVVFAVYSGDLRRRFSMADHREPHRPLFGRLPTWDPDQIPLTLKEAKAYLQPMPRAYILTRGDFNALLQGQWRPPVKRRSSPYLARLLWRRFLGTSKIVNPGEYAPAWMIDEIRGVITRLGISAVVIKIPRRDELVDGRVMENDDEDVARFASSLKAPLIDGADAFGNLTADQVRQHWLPHDGHWEQKGSDRFGNFVYQMLATETLGGSLSEKPSAQRQASPRSAARVLSTEPVAVPSAEADR